MSDGTTIDLRPFFAGHGVAPGSWGELERRLHDAMEIYVGELNTPAIVAEMETSIANVLEQAKREGLIVPLVLRGKLKA